MGFRLSQVLRALGAISLLERKERDEGRQQFLSQLLGKERRASKPKEEAIAAKGLSLHGGGRHYRGSHAPACGKCGATLSSKVRGKRREKDACFNKMCAANAALGPEPGPLEDRREQRRAYLHQLANGAHGERKARVEARLSEVEAQIARLRKAA